MSARQPPVTSPTYPHPIIEIRMLSQPPMPADTDRRPRSGLPTETGSASRSPDPRSLLATVHRAAIGICSTRDRHETPVVGTISQRHLQHPVRAVVASHAVGRRVFELVQVPAAGPD